MIEFIGNTGCRKLVTLIHNAFTTKEETGMQEVSQEDVMDICGIITDSAWNTITDSIKRNQRYIDAIQSVMDDMNYEWDEEVQDDPELLKSMVEAELNPLLQVISDEVSDTYKVPIQISTHATTRTIEPNLFEDGEVKVVVAVKVDTIFNHRAVGLNSTMFSLSDRMAERFLLACINEYLKIYPSGKLTTECDRDQPLEAHEAGAIAVIKQTLNNHIQSMSLVDWGYESSQFFEPVANAVGANPIPISDVRIQDGKSSEFFNEDKYGYLMIRVPVVVTWNRFPDDNTFDLQATFTIELMASGE